MLLWWILPTVWIMDFCFSRMIQFFWQYVWTGFSTCSVKLNRALFGANTHASRDCILQVFLNFWCISTSRHSFIKDCFCSSEIAQGSKTLAVWFRTPPKTNQKLLLYKVKVQQKKKQYPSAGQSAHSIRDRFPSSLLNLFWLDPCCLDTVHTAVWLGHSQASEESGVNGTRKYPFFPRCIYL